MIFKRLYADLRAQNWLAIAIELAIVIVGVFIGVQVANWNEARIEKAATERMLDQLVPELGAQLEFFDSAEVYFATTRRFADQALAAWQGDPAVSDERFVIAAYQATQIYGIGLNSENWTLTFGGEQLRNIEDPQIRRNLEVVLTQDYSVVEIDAVATPYREQVRRLIPIRLQDQIRRACGDRELRKAGTIIYQLPPQCSVRLDPKEAHATAAALRARRDLPGELNWHLAAVAVYVENALPLEDTIRALYRDLKGRSR
ncbi:hypothetical protein [Sphingomonas mesophila]|uniref:hypothetical protein n=1 Tax=Sphingomonas mesophila TaxID=2303576 RepID=UPI000E58C52C|nr:hypothetical protein [Sphingomonas mesophila]